MEHQAVTSSLNFFVDSEQPRDDSTGDDCIINLGAHSIECDDSEIIRISLTQFTMFNQTTMIDATNNVVEFFTNGTDSPSTNGPAVKTSITAQNYANLADLATNFGDTLRAYIAARALVLGGSSALVSGTPIILPSETSLSKGTRIFSLTMAFAAPHGITQLDIRCYRGTSDSYLILGVDGLNDDEITAGVSNSFDVSGLSSGSTTISVTGKYPMQRMSDPCVYLRAKRVPISNMEMSIHDSPRGPFNTPVHNSDILAKLYKDVEFVHFHSGGESTEFFMNLQSRKLSLLHLTLTDAKNRPLGRQDWRSKTAAGTGTRQSTRGNLNFSCVLRIDTVRVRVPRSLQSQPPPMSLPAHENQNVLIWQDYGRPRH
jgi:hypothetical protein